MVSHICNSSTQRVKTVDCEFEHRLGYVVNSWIIQAVLPDPVPPPKKNTLKMNEKKSDAKGHSMYNLLKS